MSLAPLAAAAKEIRITADGVRLSARLEANASWPSGPVVLMTHGILAHRDMEIVRGLQNMFKDRGLSSLAINLGLGLNDRAAAMYDCPTPHTHKLTDAVAEIGSWVQWLKNQGVDQIALLGHSLGGNQTARYAAAHDDQAVLAVILLAPTTSDKGEGVSYARNQEQTLGPILRQAQALVADGQGEKQLGPMDFLYCKDTKASAAAIVSYYGHDPDLDTPRLYPSIAQPVVVFVGSEDPVVPDLAEKTAPLADGERIRLQVIQGADHFFRDLYSEDIADYVVEMLGGS